MGMFSIEQHENLNQDIENKATSTTSLSSLGVIRRYMNGAVYVESSSGGETFTNDFLNNPHEENVYLKRIKCSCVSVDSNCDIHKKSGNEKSDQVKKKTVVMKDNQSVSSKASSLEDDLDDLRLSICSSIVTLHSPVDDSAEKQLLDITYQNWIVKKNEEKKRIEQMQVQLKESEEILKQKQLEQERENFRRWLANKKKEEEMKKAEKQKEAEKKKIKDSRKEMRLRESDVRYRLWLKTKEQHYLEKKLNEQAKLIEMAGERSKRFENNRRAFSSWFESSKDKPKPIPTGKGLETLRSSASVTYINPVQWVPNINDEVNPSTQ